MVGRTGIRRDSRKIRFTKSYKGQEMENHDHPRPEGTWHIEEESPSLFMFFFNTHILGKSEI